MTGLLDVFHLHPFPVYITSRDADILDLLQYLLDAKAHEAPLQITDNSLTIKISFADSGEIFTKNMGYIGDFPNGNWVLQNTGYRCRGRGRDVECMLLHGSVRLNRIHLVSLIKTLYSDILPFMHGLVLHASCLAMKKGAHIFTGNSGAGKSTISSMLPGALIADDFTPIQLSSNGPIALACPLGVWEKRRHEQESAPLVSINSIVQAEHWQVIDLGLNDSVARILQNTITFSSLPQVKSSILDMAIEIAGNVTVRDLLFSLKLPESKRIDGYFA